MSQERDSFLDDSLINLKIKSAVTICGNMQQKLIKLSRIYKMISNELLYSRNDLLFEFRWALRYPHCEIVQFLSISLQPFVVTKQKRKQGSYGTSFVTILKRMVFDHKIKENTRLRDQRWIQGLS